jgi:hypothetical protein
MKQFLKRLPVALPTNTVMVLSNLYALIKNECGPWHGFYPPLSEIMLQSCTAYTRCAGFEKYAEAAVMGFSCLSGLGMNLMPLFLAHGLFPSSFFPYKTREEALKL